MIPKLIEDIKEQSFIEVPGLYFNVLVRDIQKKYENCKKEELLSIVEANKQNLLVRLLEIQKWQIQIITLEDKIRGMK